MYLPSVGVFLLLWATFSCVGKCVRPDHLSAHAAVTQAVENRTINIFQHSVQYWKPRNFNEMNSCKLPCRQVSSLEEADVVYAAAASAKVARARPDQVWVAEFWESPEHYPPPSHDYDYSYSFRQDATFANYGIIPSEVVDMFDEGLHRVRNDSAEWPRRVSFAEKSGREQMISVWISNCYIDKTGRLSIVEDLGKHGVPYASYGRCLHNAESHSSSEPTSRERELYETSAGHLFFLAAENSNCKNYHTEKVYHALLAGSIPVYVGNGVTIDDYVPKGSTIKASDFDSTEDLAEYLKRVASNETLYNSFFDWHHQDLSQTSASFRAKLLAKKTEKPQPDPCAECAFYHSHGRNSATVDSKAILCDI